MLLRRHNEGGRKRRPPSDLGYLRSSPACYRKPRRQLERSRWNGTLRTNTS